MYFVYLLKSQRDKKFYIGLTNDIDRRLGQHNNGEVQSTKPRQPLDLVYFEGYKSESDARRREKNLKLFSKAYYALRRRLIESAE